MLPNMVTLLLLNCANIVSELFWVYRSLICDDNTV